MPNRSLLQPHSPPFITSSAQVEPIQVQVIKSRFSDVQLYHIATATTTSDEAPWDGFPLLLLASPPLFNCDRYCSVMRDTVFCVFHVFLSIKSIIHSVRMKSPPDWNVIKCEQRIKSSMTKQSLLRDTSGGFLIPQKSSCSFAGTQIKTVATRTPIITPHSFTAHSGSSDHYKNPRPRDEFIQKTDAVSNTSAYLHFDIFQEAKIPVCFYPHFHCFRINSEGF